jgi:uncharacterized repeat protein (TIGR01451 family)
MRYRYPIAAVFLAGLAYLAIALAQDRSVPVAQAHAFTKRADVYHDLSRPLREFASGPFIPPPAREAMSSPVMLLGPAGLALALTFPGIATPTGTTGTPWATDASGAAGPNHYMQTVNFSAAIYDKSGNLLLGPFPTAQFWNGFAGGPCGGGWTDVIVLYDHEAQRWFVSRFAAQNSNPPPNWYQCFAISQTPDPTGAYYRYAFLIDANEFNDYPKFGIFPDAYYMTADRNKIFPGLGNFVAAFERSKMLLGQPANNVVFKIDNNGHRAGMLPADWDGHTAPPGGSPGYFVKTLDTNEGWPSIGLQIWTLQADWVALNFNLSLLTTLTPAPFNSKLCGDNQNCIPQLGTSQGLDPLAGGRPAFRLAYRNFGSHETLTFNQTVAANGAATQAGIRWYELRKSGGAWSIYQQNTFAPDGDSRWIGSLAMDQEGNMALGYNVSGSVYPSLRIAGRQVTDALNTMTEALTLKAGSGYQNGFVFWGDYSHTSLDPVDDCTFWHVGSFQPSTSNLQNWATQIGAVRFPSCTADLTVTKSRLPAGPVKAGTNVTYTVTVTNHGPNYAGNVTMTDDVPAGTAFVSLVSPGGWSCKTPAVGASGPITCKETSMAVNEVATFTIVATIDCTVPDATIISNTASANAATPPDNSPADNSQTVSLTVSHPAPIVTASVTTAELQQNNHDLVNVGLGATATDGACAVTSSFAVQVFSNEGDQAGGPDDFSPDAKNIGVGTLRLRQERLGSGSGRVYLIVVKTTNLANETGFGTVTVVVPHDSSGAGIAAVQAMAAAAKAYADAHNGVPPTGYVQVGTGPIVGPKQ